MTINFFAKPTEADSMAWRGVSSTPSCPVHRSSPGQGRMIGSRVDQWRTPAAVPLMREGERPMHGVKEMQQLLERGTITAGRTWKETGNNQSLSYSCIEKNDHLK